MKCRNATGHVKTGGSSSSRDQFGSCPEDCPSDIRHVGGAKPDQALVWNVRTCPAHDYKDVVEGWETHYWGFCQVYVLGTRKGCIRYTDFRGCRPLIPA